MQQLSHEKMLVYQRATEFLAVALQLLEQLPRGNSSVADQLKRASISIPLNIAEACGKTGFADDKKYFSIARGSALECGAILDVLKILKAADITDIAQGKRLIVETVSMLSSLCR